MSNPVVDTTGTHPLATRSELRRRRQERRRLAVAAALVLTALLVAAALIVGTGHVHPPVSGPPGAVSKHVAARAG